MAHPRDELRVLVRAMRLLVSSEREAGVIDVRGTAAAPQTLRPAEVRVAPTPALAAGRMPAGPSVSSSPAVAATSRSVASLAPASPPVTPFAPRVAALELPPEILAPFGDLPARVASCTKCALCKTRTLTVFGEGSPSARLVFCGEGPGSDEDRSGRPFVGRAGELLTDMIVKGMKLRREDVFILNAVKCRPPDNRTPLPDEIAACRPYLEEQLALIRPAVIVALGNPACQALLGAVPGITRIRGTVFEAFGAKVVPAYHPAYLLRNPDRKSEPWRDTWKDLKLVMSLLAEASGAG
jgi:uracil-DNA glycosylase